MRIVFVCGSLEPGRDGVGDYTRRLCCELIRKGHRAAAVSLNDKHVKHQFEEYQNCEGVQLPALRMPSTKVSKKSIKQIREWIDRFNPQWLSLQYVPFSFHPKGLPFGLTPYLKYLGEQKYWHIMFHELWVGMNVEAAKSYTIWGGLQRILIKEMVRRIQPACLHTHTRLYQSELSQIGLPCRHLPLFTNIPVKQRVTTSGLHDVWRKKKIKFIHFGNIHAGAPVGQLAKEASLLRNRTGFDLSLTLIGRSGTEQHNWLAAWESEGIEVELLGEQPLDKISETLRNSTIGLTSTPLPLLEKSGSVAAMLGHGLPVLCVAPQWRPRSFSISDVPRGVYEYRYGELEECFHSPTQPHIHSVSEVSDLLKNSLIEKILHG